MIIETEKQFSISVGEIIDELSYNFVAKSIDALSAMAGRGVVNLISADKALGVKIIAKENT